MHGTDSLELVSPNPHGTLADMDDPTPTVDAPSKPSLRFRRTRIALSVCFGVTALVLCVLWVRSYSWSNSLIRFGSNHWKLEGHSDRGVLRFKSQPLSPNSRPVTHWKYAQFQAEPGPLGRKFRFVTISNASMLILPYWMMVIAACVLGIAPIARLLFFARFSLRTMLIATTLVAVALGLGVWLAR